MEEKHNIPISVTWACASMQSSAPPYSGSLLQDIRLGHSNPYFCITGRQPSLARSHTDLSYKIFLFQKIFLSGLHRPACGQRPGVGLHADGGVHRAEEEAEVGRALDLDQRPELVHLQTSLNREYTILHLLHVVSCVVAMLTAIKAIARSL